MKARELMKLYFFHSQQKEMTVYELPFDSVNGTNAKWVRDPG